MVFIPVPSPLHAADQLLPPPGVAGHPRAFLHVIAILHIGLPAQHTVDLQIIFQYQIQAQPVAQLQQRRHGRIVRGAQAVNAQKLHLFHIPAQVLPGHGPAGQGMGVVVVDALELHRHPVNEQLLPLRHRYAAEAHLLPDDLPGAGQPQGVQAGLFRIPQLHPGQADSHIFHISLLPQADFPIIEGRIHRPVCL